MPLHGSAIYYKASSLCYCRLLLTLGWYSVACMQAKSICTCMYDGIKVGSALAMQAICMQCKMYGLSRLYSLYAGCYQCFDTSMATGQVVDSQWLYLVVGHLC